ncbi:ATP-binding protein [Streptomyces sp. NPDC059153]|uniref:ATP-binding protein n=1 Tax=Streptomyces sp. NPDC059153 TaxID=3346743 RepID=UPI0036CC2F1E
MRGRSEEFAAQALREHASYADFLAELLESEREDRDERREFRRVKKANFPRSKRIEDFDFSKNPNVPLEVISTSPPGSRSATRSEREETARDRDRLEQAVHRVGPDLHRQATLPGWLCLRGACQGSIGALLVKGPGHAADCRQSSCTRRSGVFTVLA